MLNFYDFEVFEKDWLVVFINPAERSITRIINDRRKLADYYVARQKEYYIGYNSSNYDQYIFKALLWGEDPKKVNDFIIKEKQAGWKYSELFREPKLLNYDLFEKDRSLKRFEGWFGDSIIESSIPFDYPESLTKSQLEEIADYCQHDVEETMKFFMLNQDKFLIHIGMIKQFNLPLEYVSKSTSGLVCHILGAFKKELFYDDFKVSFIDSLKITKYAQVIEWFKSVLNASDNDFLKIDIAGVEHTFRWGGVHGGLKKYHDKGFFIHIDAASFYPSIMLKYKFLPRNAKNKAVYRSIYNNKMTEEDRQKKQIYKAIINKVFGCMKDIHSAMYDPLMANNVTVNGQLLLLDLIEHLEPVCQLIQSNTDGLIIKADEADFDRIDDICFEWEERTGLKLDFEYYTEIWQKDVNNYIAKTEEGEYIRRGASVKETGETENDLAIVNEAVFRYITEDIRPEDTIKECTNFKAFQRIVRLPRDYSHIYHNNKANFDRTHRIFSSKDVSDTVVQMVKDNKKEKVANCPEHTFIDNSDINGKEIPEKLDRRYYIELAKRRITDFGFGDFEEKGLFE